MLFGALGGRRILGREHLVQVGADGSLRPPRIVEPAVDRDGTFERRQRDVLRWIDGDRRLCVNRGGNDDRDSCRRKSRQPGNFI